MMRSSLLSAMVTLMAAAAVWTPAADAKPCSGCGCGCCGCGCGGCPCQTVNPPLVVKLPQTRPCCGCGGGCCGGGCCGGCGCGCCGCPCCGGGKRRRRSIDKLLTTLGLKPLEPLLDLMAPAPPCPGN